MKSQISRIKYFNVNGPLKILNFDKSLPVNMLITLWNKFGLNKRDIDGFVSDNKNLGVFLYLSKKDISFSENWKQFIDVSFPKKKYLSKLDNVIINKDYSMLLLITERKLLSEKLKNLNQMIFKVNKLIKEQNSKNFRLLNSGL
jgi:hypothetical protein